MKWDKLREVGYRLYLTKNEQSVLLFLGLSMLAGSAIIGFNTIFGSQDKNIRRTNYGALDLEFFERSHQFYQSIDTTRIDAQRLDSLTKSITPTSKKSTSSKKTIPVKVININIATIDELITLPYIGASTAQKIVDHRNTHGTFKRIDEIKNVKSIGDKKFEKLQPYISVK